MAHTTQQQSVDYLSEYNMLLKKYGHIFKLRYKNFDDYYKTRSPIFGNYSLESVLYPLIADMNEYNRRRGEICPY